MKSVNVVFEDSEVKALIELKGKKSWHDFILSLLDGGKASGPKI